MWSPSPLQTVTGPSPALPTLEAVAQWVRPSRALWRQNIAHGGAGPVCVSIRPRRSLSAVGTPAHPLLYQCSLSPFSREARAALHCISVGLCVAELRDGEETGQSGSRLVGSAPCCPASINRPSPDTFTMPSRHQARPSPCPQSTTLSSEHSNL